MLVRSSDSRESFAGPRLSRPGFIGSPGPSVAEGCTASRLSLLRAGTAAHVDARSASACSSMHHRADGAVTRRHALHSSGTHGTEREHRAAGWPGTAIAGAGPRPVHAHRDWSARAAVPAFSCAVLSQRSRSALVVRSNGASRSSQKRNPVCFTHLAAAGHACMSARHNVGSADRWQVGVGLPGRVAAAPSSQWRRPHWRWPRGAVPIRPQRVPDRPGTCSARPCRRSPLDDSPRVYAGARTMTQLSATRDQTAVGARESCRLAATSSAQARARRYAPRLPSLRCNASRHSGCWALCLRDVPPVPTQNAKMRTQSMFPCMRGQVIPGNCGGGVEKRGRARSAIGDTIKDRCPPPVWLFLLH